MSERRQVSVEETIHSKAGRLGLSLVAGLDGLSRSLPSLSAQDTDTQVVGYFDPTLPLAIQILVPETCERFRQASPDTAMLIQALEAGRIAALIITDDETVPECITALGDQYHVCIYRSSLSHSMVFERLQHRVGRKLVEKTTLHGVFLAIQSVGALIQGPSGIGKSEVALDLINRGHRLIADDVVQVFRSSPYKLTGYCPELLRGHLEIRGLGILDIADLYGNTAILDSFQVDMIIRLERDNLDPALEHDRLGPKVQNREILQTSVPEITVQVAPGRNIAILIEAAVRTHIQYQFGKDPVQAFIDKQRELIDSRRQVKPL